MPTSCCSDGRIVMDHLAKLGQEFGVPLLPLSKAKNSWHALAAARSCAEHLRDDVEGPGPARLGSLRLFVLLNHCSPVGFGRQHILAPGGTLGQSSATTMSSSAPQIAGEPVKYEDLPPEHKKRYDELKTILEADLIGAFEKTRRTATAGGVAGAGSSSGADAEKQAWLTKYATSTSYERSASAAPTVDEITAIMRDKFGILPKKRMIGYSKPYPNDYDLIPLPPKYRLPDFTKFSGSEGTSSIEHVSRYLAQLGMVSASDELRVRFFSQSLTGPAFGWYTSLLPDSVRTWKQLEEQFHEQYHSETTEASLADLTQVRQRRGETVSEYIQRFRTVRNRCYSVRLTEKEAVELAVAGLSAPLKDVTFQAEYNSLAHMV
ncbi:hypothetical protein QYE76_020841 [Lolium multiflorum]|uniref:Retrotransposon gag domain-containing protein n=1 Tax=Lolium multiflorum TaxID=4521 RepID=A0AAD8R8I6_LOLMU|nr:hypothetical protein QYE76_020841 [Lolium multiflorum]